MQEVISLGFSSCPNDTFIFEALINSRIDSKGLHFEPYIADVEDLNRKAFNSDLEVTKLSFGTYLQIGRAHV